MTRSFFYAALCCGLFALSGCNDDDGNSNNSGNSTTTPPDTTPAPETAQGVFLDSAVEGLNYVSGAQSGVTDTSGTFAYEVGENVMFSIGDIMLGSTAGADTLTPLQLVPGAADEADQRVVNMLRVLQTLDDDADPANGILITQTVRDLAAEQNINFDQTPTAFTDDGALQILISDLTAATSAGARMVIDDAQALAHFRQTLEQLNGPSNPPGGSNPQNVLTLGGPDAAIVGTTLTAGDIAYGRADLTGIEQSIVVVSEGATISDGPAPYPPSDPRNTALLNVPDPDNTFVLVLGADAISMTIITGGVGRDYICNLPSNSVECGDVTLDPTTRTATFNSATVQNLDTLSTLTLTGTLRWTE